MIITIHNKASKYPIGHGYDKRRNNRKEYGIVLHTTNGHVGSTYESEVEYLYNSPDVTSHYILSKGGIITSLLPVEFRAWHAGNVNDYRYNNNNSIGIEMHYTPGESKNLPLMMDSAYELCKLLKSQYHILDLKMHRTLAPKRKIDPSNLTDEEFKVFRNRVMSFIMRLKKGTVIYTDEALISKATHINTPTIKEGVIQVDTPYDVTRLESSYWMTNGYGFVSVV